MDIALCSLMGYLLGSLNPAALIAGCKKTDLRREGTHNLGASNTMLTFGKWYGLLVMLFDVGKSFLAVKLARRLFPTLALAGLLAGSAAVVGHVFPFYLRFRGGKGLAPFGGLVLGVSPLLFLLLLALTLALMFLVNYSVVMPMTAGVLFPLLYGLHTKSLPAFLLATAVSILLICKHFSNIGKARRGEDIKIREYVKTHLLH